MDRLDDSKYFQYPPWMSNKPGEEPDGNALLYMGTRIVILSKLNLINKEDCEDFIDAVKGCYVKLGLLKRGAYKKQHQSHDDYIGVCAAAHLVYPGIAADIADYGFRNGWIYRDRESDFNPFSFHFYRLAGVVQHIKVCAGIKLNLLDQLLLAGALIVSSLSGKSSTSGKIMKWLMMKSVENKGYLICDIAVWIFKRNIKRMYPNMMGDVFTVYFNESHPFALYMNGKI